MIGAEDPPLVGPPLDAAPGYVRPIALGRLRHLFVRQPLGMHEPPHRYVVDLEVPFARQLGSKRPVRLSITHIVR